MSDSDLANIRVNSAAIFAITFVDMVIGATAVVCALHSFFKKTLFNFFFL